MVVQASTGAYDDAATYTAGALAGDWWWNELGYDAVIVGGRVGYETATATGTLVRLWRLAGLKSIYRYVSPETRMKLVKVQDWQPR